jgi:glyoxylase-like metal-dependent hydrolase (beta-lactamase superfamily II)
MINIQSFIFNPFSENTYVVSDHSGTAVIVDPGCFEPDEKNQLDTYISSKQLNLKFLLNTHCHIDHVLGNDHVKSKYNVPLYIHKMEEPLLKAVKSYASNYGFAGYREALPDGYLEEHDEFRWGGSSFKVLFLPGHSPGHIAFYHAEQKILLGGDVLFQGSVGRTDLPGGDHATLIDSIQQKLFLLPDDVVVYCGHGPETTLGEEKMSNPFCALPSLR